MRPLCQSRHLTTGYQLLEEALESWHHVVANKLVYIDELFVRNDDPFCCVSELDADLDRWLEVNLTLCGQGETRFTALLRPTHNGIHAVWKNKVHLRNGLMERNPSVFVDIPEPLQSPQFRGVVSVPVVVWLKRFNHRNSRAGNTPYSPLELAPPIAVHNVKNREAAFVVRGAAGDQGKGIGQVIERRSETCNEVTSNELNVDEMESNIETNDVLSTFKIILCRDRVSLALPEARNLRIQSAEVVLRPTNLQTGIYVSRN